jgi:hypothetical protein
MPGVALCCHQLCAHGDYVHPAFVARAGLSPADFAAVCRLSCWAWSQADPRRQAVGAACTAFIDAGRCLYLREHGFDARLVEYCSAETTPMNRMLLATRRPATLFTV